MRIRVVWLLTGLLMVAGFAAAPLSAQRPTNPTDPKIASGAAHRALDRARARWRGAAIRSYRFEVRQTCFCPPSGWRVVVVRNGVASSRTPSSLKQISTVPRLFLVIQRAIDHRAHVLTATYGRHGVPTQISIDPVANIADEERYLFVRRFTRR